TLAELEEARDKVRWGKERRSLALSEKEKQNTAYHEAGHALLLELLPHTEPLHKVTIIPRGPSLGSTMWLPEEDKYTNRKNELLEFETLDGSQIKEIVEHGRLINPPGGTALPDGKKMPPEKPPKQVVAAPDVTPPLPGALGGAPA